MACRSTQIQYVCTCLFFYKGSKGGGSVLAPRMLAFASSSFERASSAVAFASTTFAPTAFASTTFASTAFEFEFD